MFQPYLLMYSNFINVPPVQAHFNPLHPNPSYAELNQNDSLSWDKYAGFFSFRLVHHGKMNGKIVVPLLAI